MKDAHRAFTLVEILIAVSILGVLAAALLVSLNSARGKAKIGASIEFESAVDHSSPAAMKYDFNDCSGTSAASGGSERQSLTLAFGPTWSSDTPASGGCSLSLDGADDYARTSAATSDWTQQSFTVSAWIKPQNAGAAVTAEGWGFRLFGNGQAVMKDVPQNPYYLTPTPGCPTGSWCHIALSAKYASPSSAVVTGYINGKAFGTVTVPLLAATNSLLVGAGNTGGYQQYLGLVDDVRIYPDALLASDIRRLYADGPHGAIIAEDR